MTIEETFGKRDMLTSFLIVLQERLANDTKVMMIEELEHRTVDQYIEFIRNEMDRLNTDICISGGWAFTHEIFEKEMELYDKLLNSEDDLYIIWMPELFYSFIIYRNSDTLQKFIKVIKDYYIKYIDVNIKNIQETDNSIEINYFNRTTVLQFEEKPEAIQKIDEEIRNENLNNS